MPICQARWSASRLQPGPSLEIAPVCWSRIKCYRRHRKPQYHNCRYWCMVQHALSGEVMLLELGNNGAKGFWLSRLKPRLDPLISDQMPVRAKSLEDSVHLDSSYSVIRTAKVHPSSKFHTSNLCPDSSSPAHQLAALSRHSPARGKTSVSREHPSPGLDPPGPSPGTMAITRRPRSRLDTSPRVTLTTASKIPLLPKISYFLFSPIYHPAPKVKHPHDALPLLPCPPIPHTRQQTSHPSRHPPIRPT